ncbi:SGNH/GDSL hydrolase family protein [Streptomyces sp. NPDC005548]|uniref:SGNH/GDSL hydrolase family protein n=1 Tax=Streptomyces sp. NPDC005548 TaxID=3364724 RepID=UPI0036CBA70B
MDVLSPLSLLADPSGPRSAAPAKYADRWRRRDLPDPILVETLYAGTAPTISVAQTSTPTTGYIKYAPAGVALTGSDVTGPFTYLGGGSLTIGSGTPDSSYVLPITRYPNSRGTLSSSQSVWSVQFGTNSQTLQMRFNYQTAGMYRLVVDGRKVADLMTAVGGTTAGNSHLMSVDFGSAAPRTVRFDFYTVPFGGIFLPPTANMWAVPKRTDRFMVLGDSLSDGSNMNTGSGAGTWAHRAARLLGSDDYWDEARGGTGYISPGTSPVYAVLGDRLALDVYANPPDRLVIWAGYNDNGGNQTTLRSAADSLYASVKSNLPSCEVYVLGCWAPTSSPATSLTNTDATIKAAAAAAGLPFVSPITGSIYNSAGTLLATHGPFITGTGKVGSTTGSGNADIYVGSDGIHPTDAGHAYLARRIVASLQELMPA